MKIENEKAYIPCEIVETQINNGLDIRVRIDKTHDLYINRKLLIHDIDQPKTVVPQFVAEWIEYCKYNSLTLLGAFEPVSEHGIGLANTFTGEVRKGVDWAKRNQDIFARAWIAYPNIAVEKEKLYTVEIPNPNAPLEYHSRLAKNYKGDVVIEVQDWLNRTEYYQLTEQEIRKDFDWAWQWKKEVTE